MFKPKGIGINTWITADDILDTACAGYADQDMLCRFMPKSFGCRALH
jgi:hypothetical protein